MKRRSDRNHIIYELVSPEGERYIGMTVVTKSADKSLEMRWKRHVYYAEVKQGQGLLQQRIREHAKSFSRQVLMKVRGKQNAHDIERRLIKETHPELNIECTNKKRRGTSI